jgi:transposase-like protein
MHRLNLAGEEVGMGQAEREKEQLRRAKIRLRRIQHYEQVTKNVSQTCRFFGISRGQFYFWLRRYRTVGFDGLKAQKCGPRKHPFATPPHIVALALQIRHERQYGPIRICLFLQRYHQVYVSVPTIYKILKRHRVPRVPFKRYRPGPRRRRELTQVGQSVQVDVKHLKLAAGRFYQFTAIDEASRYRVLKIYAQSSIPNAIAFIDEARRHSARPDRSCTNCKRLIRSRDTASLWRLGESPDLRAIMSMRVRSGLPR